MRSQELSGRLDAGKSEVEGFSVHKKDNGVIIAYRLAGRNIQPSNGMSMQLSLWVRSRLETWRPFSCSCVSSAYIIQLDLLSGTLTDAEKASVQIDVSGGHLHATCRALVCGQVINQNSQRPEGGAGEAPKVAKSCKAFELETRFPGSDQVGAGHKSSQELPLYSFCFL